MFDLNRDDITLTFAKLGNFTKVLALITLQKFLNFCKVLVVKSSDIIGNQLIKQMFYLKDMTSKVVISNPQNENFFL